MVPSSAPVTEGTLALEQTASSSTDAVTRGTVDGVQLLVNIVAMLVVLVALVSLANQILGCFQTSAEPRSRCSARSGSSWRPLSGSWAFHGRKRSLRER